MPYATEQERIVPVKEGSTAFASPRDRLRYWEAYTASELIALRCSSYADDGLHARQRNFDLGSLRIADITGNQHVVERTMPIVRRHPKDSLFACLLLEGEAFFYQSGLCTLVHSGDLIIYGTAKPYLYGFTRPMRQLMIDVRADELFESGSVPAPSSLIRIDGSLRAGQLVTQPLRDLLLGFIESPLRRLAPSVDEQIRASLRTLLRPTLQAGARADDIAALRMLRAERFIADHLEDPSLDAETVARHMAMSLRNLNRVFEKHECSVTQWIWRERLSMAHRLLADTAHSRSPIGDIALGCGFSTQAHFAREFKHQYGLTPTRYRDTAVASRADALRKSPAAKPRVRP